MSSFHNYLPFWLVNSAEQSGWTFARCSRKFCALTFALHRSHRILPTFPAGLINWFMNSSTVKTFAWACSLILLVVSSRTVNVRLNSPAFLRHKNYFSSHHLNLIVQTSECFEIGPIRRCILAIKNEHTLVMPYHVSYLKNPKSTVW